MKKKVIVLISISLFIISFVAIIAYRHRGNKVNIYSYIPENASIIAVVNTKRISEKLIFQMITKSGEIEKLIKTIQLDSINPNVKKYFGSQVEVNNSGVDYLDKVLVTLDKNNYLKITFPLKNKEHWDYYFPNYLSKNNIPFNYEKEVYYVDNKYNIISNKEVVQLLFSLNNKEIQLPKQFFKPFDDKKQQSYLKKVLDTSDVYFSINYNNFHITSEHKNNIHLKNTESILNFEDGMIVSNTHNIFKEGERSIFSTMPDSVLKMNENGALFYGNINPQAFFSLLFNNEFIGLEEKKKSVKHIFDNLNGSFLVEIPEVKLVGKKIEMIGFDDDFNEIKEEKIVAEIETDFSLKLGLTNEINKKQFIDFDEFYERDDSLFVDNKLSGFLSSNKPLSLLINKNYVSISNFQSSAKNINYKPNYNQCSSLVIRQIFLDTMLSTYNINNQINLINGVHYLNEDKTETFYQLKLTMKNKNLNSLFSMATMFL